MDNPINLVARVAQGLLAVDYQAGLDPKPAVTTVGRTGRNS